MKPKSHDRRKPNESRPQKPNQQRMLGVYQVPPPESEGVAFYMRAQR